MMVSAIESTIDQTRQPGMNRTCVRPPDRFQITNIAHAPCPAERALKQAFGGVERWLGALHGKRNF